MAYDISAELHQRVQAHLATGRYRTEEEVLCDALDALDQREADVASIQAGMDDERAGRVKPLFRMTKPMGVIRG